MNLTDKKCLIAYFPRKGQNYVSGRLALLLVGFASLAAPPYVVLLLTGASVSTLAILAR